MVRVMTNFNSPKVPIWRVLLYGFLAIGAFAWLGHALGDIRLVWAGVITVPILILLMMGIVRAANSQWAKRHIRLLIAVYIILQSALLIWRILEKH